MNSSATATEGEWLPDLHRRGSKANSARVINDREKGSMSDDTADTGRRDIVKMIGGSIALAPLATLTACSGDKPETPPEPPAAPPAEPAAAAPPPTAAPEPSAPAAPAAPGPDTPRLAETDTEATNIGYVADATSVDASVQPRYEAGQACVNCALYQAVDGVDGWGACGVVQGKLVKASGWCSVYASASG